MTRKPVHFIGSALADVRAFPGDARADAGYQIDRVQQGLPSDDEKPMPGVGPGVREIRIRTDGHAHRVFYVAHFEEAVYVLHAFEKKTQKTPARDIETGRRRYRDAVAARST